MTKLFGLWGDTQHTATSAASNSGFKTSQETATTREWTNKKILSKIL